MEPREDTAIRRTNPMFILIAKRRSSRNLLIRDVSYGTVQQRRIIPIQEMKAADMEMRKKRMVTMPNRRG